MQSKTVINSAFFILISVTNFANAEACEIDEDCTINSKISGTVKYANECTSFSIHSNVRPCGFVGLKPLICCSSPRRDSDVRLSVRKNVKDVCKDFGKRPDGLDIRICGGNETAVGEFPHFAALGYRNDENNKISFDCGGALISAKFVLTAAHCCKESLKPEIVRLGRTSLNLSNTFDTSVGLDVEIEVKFACVKLCDFLLTFTESFASS